MTEFENAGDILTQSGALVSVRAIIDQAVEETSLGGSIPSGVGSPLGSVTPADGIGSLYVDVQDGGLFIAEGLTSADWVGVGGSTRVGGINPAVGVSVGGGTTIDVQAAAGHSVALRDLGADAGTGNGLYWNYSNGADGAQDAAVQVGSTGQHTVTLADAEGTTTLAAGGLKFPTADPHVAGAWWDDSGTLTRSSG